MELSAPCFLRPIDSVSLSSPPGNHGGVVHLSAITNEVRCQANSGAVAMPPCNHDDVV